MSALVAAECPQCGAGLTMPEGQTRVDCPYCRTTLFLRDGVLIVRDGRSFGVAIGFGAGLVLFVAIVSVLAWRPVPVAPVVVAPAPVPVVPTTTPEPDYLADTDALVGLLGRIEEHAKTTGRYRFLSVSSDRTAVALTEVGPGAIDSVAISWGHTIVKPVQLTDEEKAKLDDELFPITETELRALPGLLAKALENRPEGTRVERVDLIGIGGPPRVEITLAHPREVIEPVRHIL